MPVNNVRGAGAAGFGDSSRETQGVTTARLGETVSELAKRVGAEISELLKANPHIKDHCQPLNAGQEIKIPQGADRLRHAGEVLTESDQAPNTIAVGEPSPIGDPIAGSAIRARLSEAELPQVQGGAQQLRNPIAAEKSQKWQHGVHAGEMMNKFAGKIYPQGNLDATPIERTTTTVKDSHDRYANMALDTANTFPQPLASPPATTQTSTSADQAISNVQKKKDDAAKPMIEKLG